MLLEPTNIQFRPSVLGFLPAIYTKFNLFLR